MKLSTVLRTSLTAAVLILLIWTVGIGQLLNAFSQMNLIYAVPAIVIFYLGYIVGAYNLKLLTDALGKKIKFSDMLRFYLVAWSWGLVIPGKIGEFSFVYLVKDQMTVGEATAISIIDKLITVICLGSVAFIGFFLFLPFDYALQLVALCSACGVILVLLLITPVGLAVVKKILGKHQQIFTGFSKTLKFLIFKEKKAVFLNIILTYFKLALASALTYLIFLSMGENVNLIIITTISATAILISLVPITMSGLGIREGASVFLYGLAGVAAPVTLAVHIILLIIYFGAAAIIFSFVKNKKNG